MSKVNNKVQSRKPAVIIMLFAVCVMLLFPSVRASATTVGDSISSENDISSSNEEPSTVLGPLEINLTSDEDGENMSSTLQMLFVLTIISLAPSILIMVTSFTRIVIVLHFVRSAIGMQTTPPNQILVGLALFLTFFIMSPVITQVNNEAIKPLAAGEINQEEAIEIGIAPIRTFMLEQTDSKDLRLFLEIAEISEVNVVEDIPTEVLIPSFIISELRKAFIIGFLIYIPFIIIDMVVASTLMSMGMMMLPPTVISMPFKILLFIMADGWNLIIGEVVKTFY